MLRSLHVKNLALIDESIRFLLTGTVPFEFRTTAVKGLHTKEDFRQIGWISRLLGYTAAGY